MHVAKLPQPPLLAVPKGAACCGLAAEGKPIPNELRREEAELRHQVELEDDNTAVPRTHIDDEYAHAGERNPKILITTSRDPSSRLVQFAKEVKLLLPNAQRVNRGGMVRHPAGAGWGRAPLRSAAPVLASRLPHVRHIPPPPPPAPCYPPLPRRQVVGDLVESCRSHDYTDLVVVHEHRGEPDGLVVCHLPYGPTAYFGIFNTVLRHDIGDKKQVSWLPRQAGPGAHREREQPQRPELLSHSMHATLPTRLLQVGTISEAYPHLIFERFTSKLGTRVANILKHLFPPPKHDAKRVITFANQVPNLFVHVVWGACGIGSASDESCVRHANTPASGRHSMMHTASPASLAKPLLQTTTRCPPARPPCRATTSPSGTTPTRCPRAPRASRSRSAGRALS
jgi:rRNA maturation protein Rpf1